MSDFLRVVDQIDKARNKAYNVIPSFFNRFRQWFPGLMRALFTIITANSGVGKSIFMRQVYIYDPIDFIESHPELEIDYHCILFSLEESKDAFIYKGISKKLWEDFKISISTRELKSFFNNKAKGIESKITDDILDKIKTFAPYFDKIEKYVDIVDHIRNPTGMWYYIRDFAASRGKFYWVIKNKEGKIVAKSLVPDIKKEGAKWNHYEPDNPEEFVEIIVDHMSLANPEHGAETLHKAMSLLSSQYMIRARNSFGYSPTIVQQQAADKEKIETNFKGDTLQDKLEPTLDSLGDNKLTARDADCVYSLFSPSRYKILSHNGYDISQLGNSYRYFNCLKDRDGEPNIGISLYFNGKVGKFSELPPSSDFNDPFGGKPKAFYKDYPEIKVDS